MAQEILVTPPLLENLVSAARELVAALEKNGFRADRSVLDARPGRAKLETCLGSRRRSFRRTVQVGTAGSLRRRHRSPECIGLRSFESKTLRGR